MFKALKTIGKKAPLQRFFGRPEAVLFSAFGLMVLIGTLLLALPISHAREDIQLVDAFFTSMSASCVTGLITVDTSRDWTLFGQIVILCLIQLGGLGIMSFAAVIFRIIRMKLSYRSRVVIEDSYFQQSIASEFKSIFKQIVLMTAAIEIAGFIALYILLPSAEEGFFRFFNALFHSISAFCNAGFSLYSDSLLRHSANGAILAVFVVLIILGGIGFAVLVEIYDRLRGAPRTRRRLSLHSRVVIMTSLILIIIGAAILFLDSLDASGTGIIERTFSSLFQSVTARTAGFNTVQIGLLKPLSLLSLLVLMFIGGSPGSTAGGVKTTTLVIFLSHAWHGLRGRSDINIFERRIPDEVIRRALVLLTIAILWNLAGVMILYCSENLNDDQGTIGIVFEQISAFGTVGLSTGITPELSTFGKIWISVTMYVGKLGPLTIALVLVEPDRAKIRYPVERLMIG